MNNEKYLKLSESLKLIQKAKIDDNGMDLIDDIYTDMLPQNGILKKTNLPRTTIISGRKGTGKSTIFQKSIKEIDKDINIIPIYIDVKTMFDSATPNLGQAAQNKNLSDEITKYLVYSSFIKSIIVEVKKRVKEKLTSTLLDDILGLNVSTIQDIHNELDLIDKNIDNIFSSINIDFIKNIEKDITEECNIEKKIEVELSKSPSINFGQSKGNKKIIKDKLEETYLVYLDLKNGLINNLKKIREIINIKYIYIYLDDYSEIDEVAQELFIDWFVTPLNNLSEDFIKFKIATYPGRFYRGMLDPQKYDVIKLDFYDAYSSLKNITLIEDHSIDYTTRIIENRLAHFYGDKKEFYDLFDMNKKDLYEILFEVSLNIPRKLGYILSYCFETNIVYEKKITKASISDAAVRYYDEIINSYFESNNFVLRPFNDQISIENQKEILNKILEKQRDNKREIDKSTAKLFQLAVKPTSHFMVGEELTSVLDNLELNGLISTYNKLKDKSNKQSSLYALDYGLCRKFNLTFGRPKDSEFRKYYNHTKFNMNVLIRNHLNNTQIIKCKNNHEFNYSMLNTLKPFGMKCPKCLENNEIVKCHIQFANQVILDRIKAIESRSLTLEDDYEFNIINTLIQSNSSLSSPEIAANIDCSWQLVNKRADKLIEMGLLEDDLLKSKKNRRRYFFITQKAKDHFIKAV